MCERRGARDRGPVDGHRPAGRGGATRRAGTGHPPRDGRARCRRGGDRADEERRDGGEPADGSRTTASGDGDRCRRDRRRWGSSGPHRTSQPFARPGRRSPRPSWCRTCIRTGLWVLERDRPGTSRGTPAFGCRPRPWAARCSPSAAVPRRRPGRRHPSGSMAPAAGPYRSTSRVISCPYGPRAATGGAEHRSGPGHARRGAPADARGTDRPVGADNRAAVCPSWTGPARVRTPWASAGRTVPWPS